MKLKLGVFGRQHLDDVMSFVTGGSGPRLTRYAFGAYGEVALKLTFDPRTHLAVGVAFDRGLTDLLNPSNFPEWRAEASDLRTSVLRVFVGFEFDLEEWSPRARGHRRERPERIDPEPHLRDLPPRSW